MQTYLEKLERQHRKLNRIIDNRKAAANQHDIPRLKRMRLFVKDKIAALENRKLARFPAR